MTNEIATRIANLEEQIKDTVRYANQCEEFSQFAKADELWDESNRLWEIVKRLKAENA